MRRETYTRWLTKFQLEATGATIIDLDYLEENSIAAAAKTLGQDQALDVLVNCAGVGMAPESWLETTAEQMIYKYRVMTVVCSPITAQASSSHSTHSKPA